jgi:hypothetical protein
MKILKRKETTKFDDCKKKENAEAQSNGQVYGQVYKHLPHEHEKKSKKYRAVLRKSFTKMLIVYILHSILG